MKRRNFLQTLAYSSFVFGASSMKTAMAFPQNSDLWKTHGKSKRFGDGRDWFFEKRYGMFVHFGLYAIPGWHEQYQYRFPIERNEYVKLKDLWNPKSFDPERWLDLLEQAGMKYITFTTKHCDGFCLWNTKQTTFNTMNTPYGKDILLQLANSCHRRKIPLCLYYSIVDWNNPNYPNQGRPHELQPQPQDKPDQAKYIEFVREQVRELCTNYGEIHGFWWDANRLGVVDPSINQMIRNLQPNALINNRGFDDGDFTTPERDYEKDDHISFDRPTEACQAVGMESWGYRKNEDYYNDRHLIRSIDKYLSRDANYLLNVGPDPLGIIPEKSSAILRNIGKWYNTIKESFENVEPASQLTSNRNVMLTTKGNFLYIHLNKDPEGNVVKLRPFTMMPKSAVLLNNGQKVEFELEFAPQDHLVKKAYLRLINLPTNEMCNTILIIKLEFDRPPEQLIQATVTPELIKDVQK